MEDNEGEEADEEYLADATPTFLDGDEGDPLVCILERLLLAEPCTSQTNSIFILIAQ